MVTAEVPSEYTRVIVGSAPGYIRVTVGVKFDVTVRLGATIDATIGEENHGRGTRWFVLGFDSTTVR